MKFPGRRFSAPPQLFLGTTLLDALATPLWKWKRKRPARSRNYFESTPASPVTFVDVAKEAGLNSPNVWGGIDHKRYIIEAKGSGLAFFDYDQDGWLDIYLTNGTRLDCKWPEGKAPTSRLYKNNRDGTFTDVTEKSGLARAGWQTACASAITTTTAGTISSAASGPQHFIHNNGNGTFTDVTKKAGVYDEKSSLGAGCTFPRLRPRRPPRPFRLQLHSTRSCKAPSPTDPLCQWKGIPVMCGPRGCPAIRRFVHNNGDGTFSDVSEKSES